MAALKIPALLCPVPGGRVTSAFSASRTISGVTSAHLGADVSLEGQTTGRVVWPVSGVIVDIVRGRVHDTNIKQPRNAGRRSLAPGRTGNGARVRVVVRDAADVDVMIQHVAIDPDAKIGDTVTAGEDAGEEDDSGRWFGWHVHIELWRKAGDPSSAIDPAPYLVREVAQTHTPTTSTPSASTTTKPAVVAGVTEEDDMRLNLIRRIGDGAMALTGPGIFINLSADPVGYVTAKRMWGYAIGNPKDAKGEYVPDDVLPVEWDRVGALSKRNEG